MIIWLLCAWLCLPGASGSDVIILNDEGFESTVVQSKEPWFVDFYAPWCGHCITLAPIWESMATSLKDLDVNFAKIDCTVNPKVTIPYRIRGFPTLILFNNNKVEKYQGYRNAGEMIRFLQGKGLLKPKPEPPMVPEPPDESEPDPTTTAPVEFELHYLDCRGRAEPIQLMLEDLGIQYRRVIHTAEEWQSQLSRDHRFFPTKDVPLLLAQNDLYNIDLRHEVSALRFLYDIAEKPDGSTVMDAIMNARSDMLIQAVITFGQDIPVDDQPELYLNNDRLSERLVYLEKLLIEGSPTLLHAADISAAPVLTPADWLLFHFLDYHVERSSGCLGSYPSLSARWNGIRSRENIADYLSSKRRLPTAMCGFGQAGEKKKGWWPI